MRLARTIATVAALSAVAVLPAAAQDYDADPNYGSLHLVSGFTPDPEVIRLQAGGDMRPNVNGCTGFITNAPDVRLTYDAGSLPLIISVNSSADTTLVVNGPDGSWYCDDDGGEGLNPSIRFNRPMSGRYEIWVGTFSPGSLPRAELHISELYSN